MNSVLQLLLGTWFICSTNFPMWTKGNKTTPTFNYTAVDTKSKGFVLMDEVKYLKNGNQKSIKGIDYQDKADSMAFIWRGKGLLRLAKSKWKIVNKDAENNWVVIYFSKTIFSPEGIDIISRSSALPQSEIDRIKLALLQDSILKKHVPSLKNLY